MENSKIQSAPSLLWVLLIIYALAMLIWIVILAIDFSGRKKSPKPKDNSTQQVNCQQNVVKTTGKTMTVYLCSDYPDGKITKYLDSDAYYYLKGKEGKFKIVTPSGKVYHSEPGSYDPIDGGPGIYTFCPENKYALGVEIWE